MKYLRAVRIGKFRIPLVYLVPFIVFISAGIIFGTPKVSQTVATLTQSATQTAPRDTTEEQNKGVNQDDSTSISINNDSHTSENNTSPSSSNLVNQNTNQNQSSPSPGSASYYSDCSAAIVSAGSRYLTTPWNQNGATFTFQTPNGKPIRSVAPYNPSYPVPVIHGGAETVNATIYIPYIEMTQTAYGTILIYTSCESYLLDYAMDKEPAPLINVTSINYIAPNDITYTVDRPLAYMNIGFQISSCQSPDQSLCSGYDVVHTTAMSGSFSLDPYFPQIDTYFATYPPTTVTITLSPVSSQMIMTGDGGAISFVMD